MRKNITSRIDIIEIFEYLYESWKKDVMFVSSGYIAMQSVYFKSLACLGIQILPFIVKKITDGEAGIFDVFLIEEILGQSIKFPNEIVGKFPDILQYTLIWLYKKGYIKEKKSILYGIY